MENMIDLGGIIYILDLDALSKVLSAEDNGDGKISETKTTSNYDNNGEPISVTVSKTEHEKAKEIDGPKYEVIRMCLEIVLMFNEELDETLGTERALKGTPIPFKIAFNTLSNYGILKPVE